MLYKPKVLILPMLTDNNSLLEYPHYTRPIIFKDMKVPDILVSGNHEEIKLWRKQKSLERTRERRKDLIMDKKEEENNNIEKDK